MILGLRPHDLEPAAGADAAWPRHPRACVEVVEELGTETQLVVGIDAPRLRADAVRDALDAAPGDDVLLADEDRATLTAVVDPRVRPATGDVDRADRSTRRGCTRSTRRPALAIALDGAPRRPRRAVA